MCLRVSARSLSAFSRCCRTDATSAPCSIVIDGTVYLGKDFAMWFSCSIAPPAGLRLTEARLTQGNPRGWRRALLLEEYPVGVAPTHPDDRSGRIACGAGGATARA